jgi:hypothetical protein
VNALDIAPVVFTVCAATKIGPTEDAGNGEAIGSAADAAEANTAEASTATPTLMSLRIVAPCETKGRIR